MEKRNVMITKKTRGIGFLLVNGRVVTVRSGKPVGATIVPNSITSTPRDTHFVSVKASNVRTQEGISSPVTTPLNEDASPSRVISEPHVEQERNVEAAPAPLSIEKLGELALASRKKTEKKTQKPESSGTGTKHRKGRKPKNSSLSKKF